MPPYLRLVIDAESASIHGTIPLREAFGIPDGGGVSLDALWRWDPKKIAQPVRGVTWTGRKSDVLDGHAGMRTGDLVVSESFHERLDGAHVAPHAALAVELSKADKWGIKVTGPAVPHRWLWWTERIDEKIDWPRTRFIAREFHGPDDIRRRDVGFPARADFESANRDAIHRVGTPLKLIPSEVAWLDPSLDELDLLMLRSVFIDALVSERIATKLLGKPKLKGFRILRSDDSVFEL